MDDKENTTQGGNRSFEERVFARFDALDARINNIDDPLEKLEVKSYDTKPIWERAFVEITQTRLEMRNGFNAMEKRFEDFDVRLDRVDSVVNATCSEMLTLRADFKEFRAHVKEPA